VTLQAGLSYYIEVYHINYGGSGFFNLEVDVPNNIATLPFQAYEVVNITTNATVQPEVVTFSMVGGSTGGINLKLVRTDSSNKITYNVNVTVPYGCNSSAFQSYLSNFNSFSNYGMSVQRNIYDSSMNLINTTASAAQIDYVVSLYLQRPASYIAERFQLNYTGGFNGIFTTTATTDHSPLISGTWGLNIGGLDIALTGSSALPYNISASNLQSALQQVNGFEQVVVEQYSPNNYGFGYSSVWLLKFIGFNSQVPPIIVNGGGLSGGATSPTISYGILRNYSSDITFNVDYNFLNTYSSAPNVQVVVNGVPSLCLGDCTYTFLDVY